MRHLHGDSHGQNRRACGSCKLDQRQTHTPLIYKGVCVCLSVTKDQIGFSTIKNLQVRSRRVYELLQS